MFQNYKTIGGCNNLGILLIYFLKTNGFHLSQRIQLLITFLTHL